MHKYDWSMIIESSFEDSILPHGVAQSLDSLVEIMLSFLHNFGLSICLYLKLVRYMMSYST